MKNNILFVLIIITIISGIVYYNTTLKNMKEGFANEKRCPDILIQDGSKIYLYNSKLEKIPGVNPILFNNLEDYVEFLEWQRFNNIRCPILFLQKNYDAQGNINFNVRPSPTDLQGGLQHTSSTKQPQQTGKNQDQQSPPSNNNPYSGYSLPNSTLLIDAGRDNTTIYNKNSYPAYDPISLYNGLKTPLDTIKEQDKNMLYSPNPMDDNWGGEDYTESLIDSGYYKDNNVMISIM
jgi:hypothetical protein